MKDLFAKDIHALADGTEIDEVFALADAQIRPTRRGDPYLFLTFVDRTGSITGNLFNCDTVPTEYKVGDAVTVRGTYNSEYRNITIREVVRYEGDVNPEDFLRTCPRDADEMFEELNTIIGSLQNPHLKELLGTVFGNPKIQEKFKSWPAAKDVHQNYLGGLLEHTLAVTRLCQEYAGSYDVDRDLLVAGAMLHDIGKLEQLAVGLTVEYTDVGSLFGHLILGYRLVYNAIGTIQDFPTELRNKLLHIIVSHHGTEEWGAAVKPMTTEAFLVFTADFTDARANRYQDLIRQQRPLEGNITARKDYYLETRIYAPKPEEEQ